MHTTDSASTYVNEIREVVHEVLLYGRVGRVHAQEVLVPGLGGLQPCVLILLSPLGVLFLDQAILAVTLALLHGNTLLEFVALLLNNLGQT